MVMGISDHSRAYPYMAPAWEYTEIPPASLSTLEVIIPGPTTARNNSARARQNRLARPQPDRRSRHGSIQPGISFHRISGAAFTVSGFGVSGFGVSGFGVSGLPSTATFKRSF